MQNTVRLTRKQAQIMRFLVAHQDRGGRLVHYPNGGSLPWRLLMWFEEVDFHCGGLMSRAPEALIEKGLVIPVPDGLWPLCQQYRARSAPRAETEA